MGLWCALSVLRKRSDLSVVVFESEKYLGEHTSGRNSEVLHSGIYYPTGSMKHLHCLSGNRMWREYVQTRQLPFLDCGKIIAATAAQSEGLERLLQQAKSNGVPEVRPLGRAEVVEAQNSLHIDGGFFCGTSGVLNVAESLQMLRNDVESLGGVVLLNSRAHLLERSTGGFLLEVGTDQIVAANLVNTAGLFAVELRKSLGLTEYENFFVKGSYLKLKRKLGLNTLVYPLPPASGLGLGVHLTLDTSGSQKFGPDTEIVDNLYYGLEDSLIEKMSPAIGQVFKGIGPGDLQLGYAGIRPKVKKAGVLATDFIFRSPSDHQIRGYFEFLGIESPGVTAAPALAGMLCEAL